MNPCIECGRQPGDGDECQSCGAVVVGVFPAVEPNATLEVAKAKRTLAEARKAKK